MQRVSAIIAYNSDQEHPMRLSAALLATFVSSNAWATECESISESFDRLACYDQQYGKNRESLTISGKGKWSVTTEISKFDDTTNVFLKLDSTSATNCRNDTNKHSLWVACRENTTSMWINFGGCFMSDNAGGGKVTYRLDAHKSDSMEMSESNDNSALGLWTGSSAIPFVRKMLGKSKMLIRATPFSESKVTAEFNIAGLTEAIEPLMQACGWRAKAASKPNSFPSAPSSNHDNFEGGDEFMEKILNSAESAANNARIVFDSTKDENSERNPDKLTQNETKKILTQLRECWQVDTLSENAVHRSVTLRAEVRPNGFINPSSIRLVSPNPAPTDYRIAIERAQGALQDRSCQPFSLPQQKYAAWREITVQFDPTQMELR